MTTSFSWLEEELSSFFNLMISNSLVTSFAASGFLKEVVFFRGSCGSRGYFDVIMDSLSLESYQASLLSPLSIGSVNKNFVYSFFVDSTWITPPNSILKIYEI